MSLRLCASFLWIILLCASLPRIGLLCIILPYINLSIFVCSHLSPPRVHLASTMLGRAND